MGEPRSATVSATRKKATSWSSPGRCFREICRRRQLSCEAPWFVTFQNGSFRGDRVEAGGTAAPIETVNVEIDGDMVRNRPQEVFKEAKQAVDLTQAEIIVPSGRGIKEQKNIELAKQLAEALGGEIAASRPICDSGWLPMDRQIGSSGETVAPRLYLALGISGAIQHLVGMKARALSWSTKTRKRQFLRSPTTSRGNSV